MKKLSNLYTIFTLVILIPLDFECKDTTVSLVILIPLDFECKDTTVSAHSNGFLPFIP